MDQSLRASIAGLVGGLVGGVLLAGGVAHAATSGPAQSITACAHRISGDMRVVDSAEQCRSSERSLRWNTRGPAGPGGPGGPAGPRGLPGVGGIETLVEESSRDASDLKAVSATCPPGKLVVGGGANITSDGSAPPMAITHSQFNSIPTANSWFAQAIEMRPVSSAWQVNAFVVCALAR